MKSILVVSILSLTIAGCASKDQLYYDAAKAISKDNTVSQTACWVAISDIAKGGNEGAKVGAIALAEKCKNETMKIERPRNWMGF
jgi:outer membrane lipoprotein SlyB